MSRQGDLSDPQHGGVRTTRRGDQDISAILGATQEICGKHSLIQYNGACQVEMREDDVVHIQDGDTRFKETLSTPQPAISFESVKTESSTSNGDSHRVGLEIETPHVGGQNSTYNIERYDSTSVDVVVRNVDEWLKHRSDSMSSIEFDGDMKTTEDYEFKLDTENETDAIEGESGSRVLATRDTNKPVREMDLFATPNDVSSQEVKDNVSCQRLQNNLEKRPGNEILTTNYDSSIVPQMAVMGSFTDETDATFSPQITPVATLTAFQPNSIACMETHSDLESFINQEAVACGHSTTTKDSGVESKSANMMNFCNTDIMLMTPQELERMPESGIEFEESVGPREFETSERPMDCEAENDGFERSASTGPIDIKEDGKGSEIITEVANNATTNPGSSTLATISISTDNETNTTNIVINTKLGQKAFKINTTNLMQAAATLQPITLADLVDQKGVTVLAEPQEETRQVDQNMQEERVDLNAVCDDKLPSVTCLQEEKATSGAICTHTGRCKKVWTCPEPQCGKAYTKQCKLKVHMMMHSGVRPYKCDIEGCDWAFTTVYKLKRHLETHCGLKEFTCDVDGCNRRFTTVYNLNSHKKLHAQPNSIACPIETCSARFPTRRKMELHMREHNEVDAPYKCPVETCAKMYYTANSMASHLRVHQKTNFQCTFEGCNKIFDKMSRFKVHMWKHTGERPYICNFEGCTWGFSSASKLKRHMKKHTGERQYTCKEPGCGKSFMRLEHLQGHLVTHSGDKPFKCPYESCDAKFTAKSSLYVHLKKHSGSSEKVTYPCPIENCDKKYNCKSSLRIHMLRYHTPVLASAGQLDYVALLSNDKLHDITDVENFDQVISQQTSTPLAGHNEIRILNSTGKALVGVQEFLPPVVEQASLSTTPVISPSNSILSQLREVPTMVATEMQLSSTSSSSLTTSHPAASALETQSSQMEMEALSTSCVLLENNSGSARTDYCSNHLFIDRVRKRKQLQQAKRNLSVTIEQEHLPLSEEGKPVSLATATTTAPLTSSDVILTSTAISFHDSTNNRVHFIHNQLLSDDPPPPHTDLYQEDGLLTSMANELAVPISLLTESSVSDPAGQGADFGSSSSAVVEFTGTTINLQDLE